MFIRDELKDKNILLTEQQEQSVSFYKGILLLLAVPGAGKTTSIICRNANLISEHKVAPEKICNVTFSKAASLEMNKRFKSLFPEYSMPHFSTIHSLSFQIMKEYLKEHNIRFTLIEGNEGTNKINIIKTIFNTINKEYPNDDTIDQITSFISYVRNSLIDINVLGKNNKVIKAAEEQFDNPIEIYNKYMEIKKRNNWIDFDDMLCISNNVLSTNSHISKKYKQRYEFIQVDEAQDISQVQYQIIKKLSEHSGNLCCIGDDDQTIYSWRGSDPNILLNFKDDFPSANVVYMERNFRSSPSIVDKCNLFIKGNKKRYNKNMFTKNEFEGNINIIKNNTVLDQAEKVIELIKETNNFNNNVVLYRNNSSVLPIIIECLKQDVPFNVNVKKNSIFKSFILDDILAFYMFANNNSDKESFLSIAYKLNCIYIKKDKLKSMVMDSEGNILSLLYLYMDTLKLTQLKIKFSHLKNSKNATEFLKVLFNEFNYKEYIIKKADENTIDILYALSKDKLLIEDVLSEIALLLDKLNNKTYDENGITLMTLHSSKGLEWKNVHIIDFTDSVIPNEKSDEEEERRLAYVGFSRAINNLYIHYYIEGENKVNPSMFINEFSEEQSKSIEVNARVMHSIFGKGKIISIEDSILLIDFEKHGVKKISEQLAGKRLIKAI